MSSIVSNLVEKTFSQSQSQLIAKTFRGVEEEILSKINYYRLRVPLVKEKIEELIKTSSNPEDHTITIKELNKTIHYESQENLDKLMNYLGYLSELKHTIPDFSHTPFLNSVFTRNFSSLIDSQKGLIQKNTDINEKLRKLIPSKNYLGVYIPNFELKDTESMLWFIILEEFLMLSNKNARLRSDNLVIEVNTDEVPQHISIFNPSFNNLVVYVNEKDQSVYILFLTDVLELMGPESAEIHYMSRIEAYDNTKKPKFSKTTGGFAGDRTDLDRKKYENLKTSLPDMSLEQAQRFVNIIDTDSDHRISIDDVLDLVRKNKLVWDESVVNDMFEDIFKRRSLISESHRRKPVDAYEVFHAIRYKYKKNYDMQHWTSTSRAFREQWLVLFHLVGIELPKHTLPAIKPNAVLCNYETDIPAFKTTMFSKTQPLSIKEPKPELLKKQYKPEANIVVQNTQNIVEIYTDDRDHAKHDDSNKNAFQTLVNAKFKDLTQKSEYQTVEFNTQAYYKEALRLSKDPESYMQEKVNPIFKYVPVKKDYVYQQLPQEFESMKDTRSGFQTDEVEFDESVEPNVGSKRVTMYSIREPGNKNNRTLQSLKQTGDPNVNKIYGSDNRLTTLASSMKARTQNPHNSKSNRAIFVTSFKTPDNETIRAQVAKLEPIVDGYNPPKHHHFRDDAPPEGKPQFVLSWKEGIPDANKNQANNEDDGEDAAQEERYLREMYEMRMKDGKFDREAWIKYFKLAPRERGFVTHKYPEFLSKGSYVDGYVKAATFIREDMEAEVPFKLFHRSLRKTDKNLVFGDMLPSKM